MKVLVIIPAFNEEDTILMVLEQLHRAYPHYDLLVINDASTDRTPERAAQCTYARVIHLPYNLGIGGSVQTGFRIAAMEGYDVAVQFDADGQHNPEDLQTLVDIVAHHEADIAIGSRFNIRDKGGFRSSGIRRLGIKIFQWTSSLLIGQLITDHTSGFRAYNRKALEFLAEHYPVDYPEPEVIITMGRQGFSMQEAFTQMYKRQGGASSIPLYKGPYYMTKVMLSMLMAAIRSK